MLSAFLMATLASLNRDALKGGREPQARRRRLEDGSVAAPASSDDMWKIVNATAALSIASAEVGLDNELRIRNHGAALETVVETDLKHPVAGMMVSAGALYDAAVKTAKSDGGDLAQIGAPDEWRLKAGLIGLVEALKEGPDRTALSAIVEALRTPADFLDLMHYVEIHVCDKDREKAGKVVLVIAFGDKGVRLKRIWQNFWKAVPDTVVRRGRPARKAVARIAQDKLLRD